MKLATWNVNSLSVRLPQLLDWLAANPVDAVVLQETKLTDDKFPHEALSAAGYHAQWFGQRTYNGVALLSRQPATDVQRNIPGFADEQARVITASLPCADGQPLRFVGAARTLREQALPLVFRAQGPALTGEDRGRAAIDIATANVYAGEAGLAVSSEIFEVMGARSATNANGFDRFWRNVRTHTLHNPAEYKKRTVGTWLLAGEFPVPAIYR